jgi:hypothetical protein
MRNPISIEAFAEFCERKPAGEVYDFFDNCNCAFGQYLQSLGFEKPVVSGFDWSFDKDDKAREFPHSGMGRALSTHPRTFSDLAQRLRAAMAEG